MAAVDESAVRDRFASIAETVDDSDWNEVLARAGFASKGRAFSTLRGRAALVGLGAALALAAAATGFFALRSNAASGSAPGPKRVERQLQTGRSAGCFAMSCAASRSPRPTSRWVNRRSTLAAGSVRACPDASPKERSDDRGLIDRQTRPQHLHDCVSTEGRRSRGLRDRTQSEALQRLHGQRNRHCPRRRCRALRTRQR